MSDALGTALVGVFLVGGGFLIVALHRRIGSLLFRVNTWLLAGFSLAPERSYHWGILAFGIAWIVVGFFLVGLTIWFG